MRYTLVTVSMVLQLSKCLKFEAVWEGAAGFSLGRLHMGGICPPHMGGTSAGGQIVNGGTHEGGHRPLYGT